MELTVKVLEDLWTARRERALGETEERRGEEVREVGVALLEKLMQAIGRKYRGKAGFAALKSLRKGRISPDLDSFPGLFSGSSLLSKSLSKALRKQLASGYQAIQRLSVCYRADHQLQSALLRQVYCAWLHLQSASLPRPAPPCQVLASALRHLLWTRIRPVIAGTLGGMRALKLAQLLARKKEPHSTVVSHGPTPSFSSAYSRSLTGPAFPSSDLASSLDSRHIAFQLVYQFVETRIYKVLNRSKRRLLRWAFLRMYLVPKYEDRVELGVRKMEEIVEANAGKCVRMRWGKWIKAAQKEEIRANLLKFVLKRQAGLVVKEETREVDKNRKENRRKTLGIALFSHILREIIQKNFNSLIAFPPNSSISPLQAHKNSISPSKQQLRNLLFATSLNSIVQKHVHFLQFQCLKGFICPPQPSISALKIPLFVHLGTAEIKRKAMWLLRAKMGNCLYVRLRRLISLRVEMRSTGKRQLGNAFWQWNERVIAEKERIIAEKYIQKASKYSRNRKFTPASSKPYKNLPILIEAMTASLYKRPFQFLVTQTGSESLAKVLRLSRLVTILGQYYRLRVGEGWNALDPGTAVRAKAAFVLGKAVEGLFQREKAKIGSLVLKRLSGVEKERKEQAVKRLKRAILGVERLKNGQAFQKLADFPAFRLFPALSRPLSQSYVQRPGNNREIVTKAGLLSLFRTMEVLPAFQFSAFSHLSAFARWKKAVQRPVSDSDSMSALKSERNRELVAALARSGRELQSLQWTAGKDWDGSSRALVKVLLAKELRDLRTCKCAALVRWLQVRPPHQAREALYRAIQGKVSRDQSSSLTASWTAWKYPDILAKRPLIERLRVPIRLSIEPAAELPLTPTAKALLTAAKDRASLPVLRLHTFLSALFTRSARTAVDCERAVLECWKYGSRREEAAFVPVQMGKSSKRRSLQRKKPAEEVEMRRKLRILGELVGRKQLTDQRAALYWAFLGWEQLTCGGSWTQLAVLRTALQAKTHRDEKYTGLRRWKQAVSPSSRANPALRALKTLAKVVLSQQGKSTRLAQRSALLHWTSKPSLQPLYRTESISALRTTAKSVALGKALVGQALAHLGRRLGTAWAVWSAQRRKEARKLRRFDSKLEAIVAVIGRNVAKQHFFSLHFAFMAWKNRLKMRKLSKIVAVKVVKDLLWSLKRPFLIPIGQFEYTNWDNSPLFLRLKALSSVLITPNHSKLPPKGPKAAFLQWKRTTQRDSGSLLSHSLIIPPLSAHHRPKQLSIDRLTGLQILSPPPSPACTLQMEKLRAFSRVLIGKRLKEIEKGLEISLNRWKETICRPGKSREVGESPGKERLRALARVVVDQHLSAGSPKQYSSLQRWRDWAKRAASSPERAKEALSKPDLPGTPSWGGVAAKAAESPAIGEKTEDWGTILTVGERKDLLETTGLVDKSTMNPGSDTPSMHFVDSTASLPTTREKPEKQQIQAQLPALFSTKLTVLRQVLCKCPHFSLHQNWQLWAKGLPFPTQALVSPASPFRTASGESTEEAQRGTSGQQGRRKLQALALVLLTQSGKEGGNCVRVMWERWSVQLQSAPLAIRAAQRADLVLDLEEIKGKLADISKEEGKEWIKRTALVAILRTANTRIRTVLKQVIGSSLLPLRISDTREAEKSQPNRQEPENPLPNLSKQSNKPNQLEALSQVLRKYPNFPLYESWKLWTKLTKVANSPCSPCFTPLLLALAAATGRGKRQALRIAMRKWSGKPQLLPSSAGPGKVQALGTVLLTHSAKQGATLPLLWGKWRMQAAGLVLDLPFSANPGRIAIGLQPFPLHPAREPGKSEKAIVESSPPKASEGRRTSVDLERSQTNAGKPSSQPEQRSRVEALVQALSVQSAKGTPTLTAAWLRLSQRPSSPSKTRSLHDSRGEMPRQLPPATDQKLISEEGEKRSQARSRAFAEAVLRKNGRDGREAVWLGFAKLSERKLEKQQLNEQISQGKYSKLARVLARNQLRESSNRAQESWLQWKALPHSNPPAVIHSSPLTAPVHIPESRDSEPLRQLAKVLSSEKARREGGRLHVAYRQWNGTKTPQRFLQTDILEAPFTPTVTQSSRNKPTLPQQLPLQLDKPSKGHEGNPFDVEETEARKVPKLPLFFAKDKEDAQLKSRIKLLAGVMARQAGRNDMHRLWASFIQWRNPSQPLPEMPAFPDFSQASKQLSAFAKVLVGNKLKERDITLPGVWAEWSQQPEAITSPKSKSLSSTRGAKLRSSRSLAASSPRSPIEDREVREKVGNILTKQQGKAERNALKSAWKRWAGPLSIPLQATRLTGTTVKDLNAPMQDRPGGNKGISGESLPVEGLLSPTRPAKDHTECVQPEIEFSPDWGTHIDARNPQKAPKETLNPALMENLRINRLKTLVSVLIPKGIREENLALQRAFWLLADRKVPLKLKSAPEMAEKRKKLTALAKALVEKEGNSVQFRLGSAWLALAQVSQIGKQTQVLPELELQPISQDWSEKVPAKAGNTRSKAKRSAPPAKARLLQPDLPGSSGQGSRKGSDFGDIAEDLVVPGQVTSLPIADLLLSQRMPSFSPMDTDFNIESEDLSKAEDYSIPISHRDSDAEDVKVPAQGKRLRNSAKASPKHSNIAHPKDILSLWRQQSAPVSPLHRARKPPIPHPVEYSKEAEKQLFPSVGKAPTDAQFAQFPISRASSSTSKEPQASLKVSWDSPLTEAQFYGQEPESPTFYQANRPWHSKKGSREGSDVCESEGIRPWEEQEVVITSSHVSVLPKRLQPRSQKVRLQSAKATAKPQALACLPALAAVLQRRSGEMQKLAFVHWKSRTKRPRIVLRKVQSMSSAPRKYAHFRGEVTYLKGNLLLIAQKLEQLQALISRKAAKRLATGFTRWRNSLRSRRVVTSPSDMGELWLRPVLTHSSKQKPGKTFDWQRVEESSRLEIRPVSSLSKSFWRPVAGEKRIAVLSPRSRTTLPSPSGAGSFVLSPRALPLYSSPYLPESYATLQFLAQP